MGRRSREKAKRRLSTQQSGRQEQQKALQQQSFIMRMPNYAKVLVVLLALLGAEEIFFGVIRKQFSGAMSGTPVATLKFADEPETTTETKQALLPSREIPVDSSIPIPEFNTVDKPVDFSKPAGLDMADAAFKEVTSLIAQNLQNGIETFLKPNLAKTKTSQGKDQLIRKFISMTADMISTSHPAVNAEMESFMQKWIQAGRSLNQLLDQLNTYIHAGGHHLRCQQDLDGHFKLNYYPIKKTAQVAVSDTKGSAKIPALYLGSGLITEDVQDSSDWQVATCDPLFQHLLIFSKEADKAMDAVVSEVIAKMQASGVDIKTLDIDQLRKNIQQDFLHHEAIHAFLARRFKSARINDVKKAFKISFSIPAGKRVVSLDGAYPPIMFQELCGVGGQIATTKSTVPYANLMFNGHGAHTYHLVKQLLPAATLQVAPESDLKQGALHKMHRASRMDDADMEQLTLHPPFTMEHARQVGEILYRVGYSFLEQVDQGKLMPTQNMR